MESRLSVSIVAYHNYEEILEALQTLERYTPPKLGTQIYIIDNGNDEEHHSQSLTFQQKIAAYTNIEYIDPGKNLGFGKGHNLVLDSLKSEYHCIMNPDIVFIEDAFSPIIKYLDTNLDVGMVIPNLIDEGGDRQKVYRKELTVFDMFIRMFCKNLFPKRVAEHTLQNEDYSKPFQVPFGQGSFLVIRTELYKRLHGFDDGFFMYLEDADLSKRVNQVSKLMYFPGATIIHKWKQGSHKNLRLFKYHVNSMRYYFHKWGYKWY